MSITIGQTRWNYYSNVGLGTTVFEGGYWICRSGGVLWIAAFCGTSTLGGSGTSAAVSVAQGYAPCGDWFVPTISQMQNPAYVCKAFWGDPGGCFYSSTVCPYPTGGLACYKINMTTGAIGPYFPIGSTQTYSARAFRCVTY